MHVIICDKYSKVSCHKTVYTNGEVNLSSFKNMIMCARWEKVPKNVHSVASQGLKMTTPDISTDIQAQYIVQ